MVLAVVGVVVVAAVGITGFVAPGFLVAEDTTTSGRDTGAVGGEPASTTESSPDTRTSETSDAPEIVPRPAVKDGRDAIEQFAAAINASDTHKVAALNCGGIDIVELNRVLGRPLGHPDPAVRLTPKSKTAASSVQVAFTAKADGVPVQGTMVSRLDDVTGDWCVDEFNLT